VKLLYYIFFTFVVIQCDTAESLVLPYAEQWLRTIQTRVPVSEQP